MRPGNYCFVITLQFSLDEIGLDKALATFSQEFTVPKRATRHSVNQQVIQLGTDHARNRAEEKVLPQAIMDAFAQEPAVLFLSINPN